MAPKPSALREVILNHQVQIADGHHLHLETGKVILFRASNQCSVFKTAKAFNPCPMALAIEKIRTQFAHIALLLAAVAALLEMINTIVGRGAGFFNLARVSA